MRINRLPWVALKYRRWAMTDTEDMIMVKADQDQPDLQTQQHGCPHKDAADEHAAGVPHIDPGRRLIEEQSAAGACQGETYKTAGSQAVPVNQRAITPKAMLPTMETPDSSPSTPS